MIYYILTFAIGLGVGVIIGVVLTCVSIASGRGARE